MGRRGDKEQIIHDWIVDQVVEFLKKRYKDIRVNYGDERNEEIKGLYPDIIVYSHGMPVEVYEVETVDTVDEEEAQEWVDFSKLPVKVTILVPASRVKEAREIVWQKKIASKVKVSSYEFVIKG